MAFVVEFSRYNLGHGLLNLGDIVSSKLQLQIIFDQQLWRSALLRCSAAASLERFVYDDRTIYEWEQTIDELHMYLQLPPGVRIDNMCQNVSRTVLDRVISTQKH